MIISLLTRCSFGIRAEDFDITKGTILDSQLRPAQFDEVTAAIFLKLNQRV